MKKIEIIFLSIAIVLAIIVISTPLFLPGQKPKPTPLPIQTFLPSPQPSPLISIPAEMQAEKTAQENYAKDRYEYIQSKPWVLKIPIKSDNYFVSYDSELDILVAELYYLENTDLDKNQQLSQAKDAALSAIISIGVDPNKQKIEYLELLKK